MAGPSIQPQPELEQGLVASSGPKLYRCGTLTYAKMGLFSLFSWLLWGDFCFQIMETVVGTNTLPGTVGVLPLKLRSLGVSNFFLSFVLTSLPAIMGMTICPWISFRSDRHRSRLGRRIPFILSTMPFLTISLLLLGWSDDMVPLLQRWVPALAAISTTSITIWLIAVFLVAFLFFNQFVNSVYWYLFNDVVPPQFLGRFFGLFRMVTYLAVGAYNYFIFRYATTNMREIFTGGALIYVFGVGLMCLFVKEGKYPPPPREEQKGFIEGLKTFVKQSYTSRFYWYFYLMKAFAAVALAFTMYELFFNQEMGLTVVQFGQAATLALGVGLAATYFTAVLVDRWHPLRIQAYLSVFLVVTGLANWVWIFVTLPAGVYFHIYLGSMLISAFALYLRLGCEIPTFMRLMPKSLYGQLSSANAIIRALAVAIAPPLCGKCIDLIMTQFKVPSFGYRFIFIWPWIFNAIAAFFICLGYREWKRLGGDEGYCPPAPWMKNGFEPVTERVPHVPTKPRAVMVSMWLGVLGLTVNLVMVAVFMYLMWQHGLESSLSWYGMFFVPIELGLIAASYTQLTWVRRDIATRAQRLPTRYGVPHHGVLLVNAIQALALLPIFWYELYKTIELGLGREMIIFGIASLVSMGLTIVGVQILRWLERDVVLAAPVAKAA